MEIAVPDLGENIEEAEVLNVLVRAGDTVAQDQPVLELETDKATFELPSPQAGTVSAVHVKKGDTVRVGQKILTLEAGATERDGTGSGSGTAKAQSPARDAARRNPSREQEHPDEDGAADAGTSRERDEAADDDRDDARRTRRRDEAGDEDRDDVSEPKPREAARADGGRARQRRAADQDDTGQAPLPTAASGGRSSPAREQEDERLDDDAADSDTEVAAGPAARRLARESGVDLARIRGTGSGGRITPEDVQAFVRADASARRSSAAAAPADDERWGPVGRRPLSGIEKAAAQHLAASWNEIPHVTHHDLADVTDMEEARGRYESVRTHSQPKLTWTALVVKAVVAGLKKFPKFNSSLDVDRHELVLKRRVHVGIAVDTEHGLLVPVVRDADRMTTGEIAAEIASLAERARARKLGRDDMQGAGFTVTNLGGIGGVAFTPIISRPEVAILGVARGRDDVAWRDGVFVRRLVLPLSLSYDHRVINGADAARFVRDVAGLLENPVRLLIES